MIPSSASLFKNLTNRTEMSLMMSFLFGGACLEMQPLLRPKMFIKMILFSVQSMLRVMTMKIITISQCFRHSMTFIAK